MSTERKVSYEKANLLDPNFISRQVIRGNILTLTLNSQGLQNFVGRDFEAESRFSSMRAVVALDENGVPNHDRLSFRWKPCVIVVPWGMDKKTNEVKVGVISQIQVNPENPVTKNCDGVLFEQLVMGFLEKDEEGYFEDPVLGAVREFCEESGTEIKNDEDFKDVIKSIYRPHKAQINYAVALHESWTDIVFLEVDPEKVGLLVINTDDEIKSFEMVPLEKLEEDIHDGFSDKGYMRDGGSITTLYIWRTHLAELIGLSKRT